MVSYAKLARNFPDAALPWLYVHSLFHYTLAMLEKCTCVITVSEESGLIIGVQPFCDEFTLILRLLTWGTWQCSPGLCICICIVRPYLQGLIHILTDIEHGMLGPYSQAPVIMGQPVGKRKHHRPCKPLFTRSGCQWLSLLPYGELDSKKMCICNTTLILFCLQWPSDRRSRRCGQHVVQMYIGPCTTHLVATKLLCQPWYSMHRQQWCDLYALAALVDPNRVLLWMKAWSMCAKKALMVSHVRKLQMEKMSASRLFGGWGRLD